MLSFTDVDGNVVTFEYKHELSFDEATDVVTHEISKYFVFCNECRYEVNEKTYKALNDL